MSMAGGTDDRQSRRNTSVDQSTRWNDDGDGDGDVSVSY